MDFDPRTTPVKRNRAQNIDSDRLMIRRGFLIPLVTTNAGTRTFEARMPWVMRVAELVCIERVLVARGVISERDRATKEG